MLISKLCEKKLIFVLLFLIILYISLENIAYCMDYPDHAQGDFDDKTILDRKKRIFFKLWAIEKDLQNFPMIDIKRLFYRDFCLQDRRNFNSLLRECGCNQEIEILVKDYI